MTNRQEVAEKLRRIEEDVDYETAFMEIDTIIGTKDNYSFSFFFNRLADLIDPTCRIYWTDTSFNTPDTGYVADGYYSCSNCDGELGDILAEMWDSFQARGYEGEPPFEYCPYCGARVVSDV